MAGTLVANTINTDTGLFSTQNAYQGIAKAWVNFNGTAGTILNSFNISSITKNTTGDYTFAFTTAMSSANYAVAGSVSGAATASVRALLVSTATAPTTSAVRVMTSNTSTTEDNTYNSVVIFAS